MGEAKIRREQLRAALLADADRWLFPPSDEERAIAAELMGIEPRMARRESADRLKWGGMVPQQCHKNASWYADNDPTGTVRHVIGWWRQGDHFVLHSVIGMGDDLICITPQMDHVPEVFPFIPDDTIQQVPDGDYMTFQRDGWTIPLAVRANPEATIAGFERMKERLVAGMPPWTALDLADREHIERLTALAGDGE